MRIGHFSSQRNVAQIIMIPKPGKLAEEATSYCSNSKPFFQKAKSLNLILEASKMIPERICLVSERIALPSNKDRVVGKINAAFEMNKYCSAAFLEVTQVFDKFDPRTII